MAARMMTNPGRRRQWRRGLGAEPIHASRRNGISQNEQRFPSEAAPLDGAQLPGAFSPMHYRTETLARTGYRGLVHHLTLLNHGGDLKYL